MRKGSSGSRRRKPKTSRSLQKIRPKRQQQKYRRRHRKKTNSTQHERAGPNTPLTRRTTITTGKSTTRSGLPVVVLNKGHTNSSLLPIGIADYFCFLHLNTSSPTKWVQILARRSQTSHIHSNDIERSQNRGQK